LGPEISLFAPGSPEN